MKALRHILTLLVILLGLCASAEAQTEKVMSLCQFHYPTDYLYEWDCVKVTSKSTPYRVFGKLWKDGLRFNRMDRRHFLTGMWVKVPKRMAEIKNFNPMPPFWPEADKLPQFILVDQNEMFLGAYEYGKLVMSTPVAVGTDEFRLANGFYRIDAFDAWHESSLYPVDDGTYRGYPMHYGLRFHIDKKEDGWTSYWIHGRDIPGYPASHGCIGLYDEEMQKEYYGEPVKPVLMDALKLYQWVVGELPDSGTFQQLNNGPVILIMGNPPIQLIE